MTTPAGPDPLPGPTHGPQNVYDDPDFQGAYADLPRSRLGLPGAPEWPAVRDLLPPPRDLAGADVVDLGCGYGAFCRWAIEQGAASVLGLDLSMRMLARARTESGLDTVDPDAPEGPLRYEASDLEQVSLRYASYDLVYSALVLHYLTDPLRLFRVVNAGLRPGGRLVATFEHPLYTAPTRPGFAELDGRRVWPLDAYAEEGERVTDWLAPGVRKQHRTLGTTLTALARAGLVLRELIEWAPTPEQVVEHPEWAAERDRPMFVLLRADKPLPGILPR